MILKLFIILQYFQVLLSATTTTTTTTTTTGAQTYVIPLSNIRSEIDVLTYTSAERVQVAQSIKDMFSIYVNRQSKIDNYRHEYPDIDPIPRIQSILDDAANLSDMDFHYKLIDLYMSLRDHHAVYYIPGSHSCVQLKQAIIFDVINKGSDQKIVAASKSDHPDILKYSPQIHAVTSGDELISVNGIPTALFIHNHRFLHGGANDYGALRASISALTSLDGRSRKLPKYDHQIFLFVSLLGREYQVRAPWIALIHKSCWEESKEFNNALHADRVQEFNTLNADRAQGSMEFNNDLKSDLAQESMELNNPQKSDLAELDLFQNINLTSPQFLGRDVVSKRQKVTGSRMAIDSISDTIDWEIKKRYGKDIGIIYLKSFLTLSEKKSEIVDHIRGLLLNELKITDALIIDVRSNFGGLIEVADLLPQLFTSKVIKTGFGRTILSPINQKLFTLTPGEYRRELEKWSFAYYSTKKGDHFTRLIQWTPEVNANRLGQAYTKPVGVFTNADCYSACSLFAANMKDNHISIIFGEDGTTGGGGASSIEYTEYLHVELPKIFPGLPYEEDLELSEQFFKIPWRQTLRLDGSMIEDIGVTSDYIIRPRLIDIQDTSSNTQIDRIADILIGQGQNTGQSNLVFEVQPLNTLELQLGEKVLMQISTMGVAIIRVVEEGGVEIFQKLIDGNTLTSSIISIVSSYHTPALQRLNIQGISATGELNFNTWRIIKWVPRNEEYLKIPRKMEISFDQEKYIGFYDDTVTIGSGWIIKEGGFRIGDGISYDENLHSTFSIFVKARMTVFKIEGSYDTERDASFVQIGYIQDGITTHLLQSEDDWGGIYFDGISGKGDINRSFILPNGELEVFVRFVSGVEYAGFGAIIDSITFEPMKVVRKIFS